MQACPIKACVDSILKLGGGGVRSVKTCIRMIVDKLSFLLHTSVAEQEQLQLSFNVNVTQKPVIITPEVVDELFKSPELKNTWQYMYL